MKTEADLTTAILKISLEIQEKFPELNKYLVEMPVTIPDSNDPEISIKKLQEYLDSLTVLLSNYKQTHGSTNI